MPSLHLSSAIITGASRGIGLAIAKSFAANGASTLHLLGRDTPSLERARESILSEHSSKELEIQLHTGNVKDRDFWVEVGKQGVSCPKLPMLAF